jgi:hypothetical protein
VVLDRASLPVVIGPHRLHSLRLLNEIADRLHRHLALAGGEPPIGLEKLEHRREAQATGTALVHQQQKFIGRERPSFDQLFLGKLSLHRILMSGAVAKLLSFARDHDPLEISQSRVA